jgi:hypothetical protein
MKWCRCGGENPNCCDCGGKGYLTDSDGPKQVLEKVLPSAGSVACPKCKARIRPANLARHLRRTHREPQVEHSPSHTTKVGSASLAANPVISNVPSARTPAQSSSLPGSPLISCKNCRASVRPNRLARHAKRCPALRIGQSPALTQGSNAPISATGSAKPSLPKQSPHQSKRMKACDQCGAPVKNFVNHLRKCVKRRSKPVANNVLHVARPSRAEDRRNLSNPHGSTQPYDKNKDHLIENRLDKTRDYGRFFRDQGRFGSPVSHDDFDDDSSP